ncbi:hypothetical protein [Neobacillus sp. SAB-20_R2A]|uniref:hypothetical protein n=1 Tax=Neobacillus sp. SAB-20_R2A TaxID=3120519 RepID=UPI003C6DD174
MEEALLHGNIINIEAKRQELESESFSRDDIISKLNDQYRVLSKKRAFTCRCCNESVNMNLTKEEGWPFYFKHYDGKKCSYSENSKTYEKQVSSQQDKQKKDIGLTVFREILEGQLKPIGAEIERGYFYKKKLSFIPDFIVRFPHSKERWAIDYYTSITQGGYAQNIEKRLAAYSKEGFKAFSFIDDVWLAIDPETSKGTLLTPEMQVTRKSQEDEVWDHALNHDLPLDIQTIISEVTDLPFPVETRSIAYVDPASRSCKIIRFAVINRNNSNVTFLKLSEPTIPLERALTLNTRQDDFLLYLDHEEELRLAFLDEIMDKQQQAEREEMARREALEKIKREEEERLAVEHFLKLEALERAESVKKNKQIDDEQIEREMAQRAEEARQRPIDMTPEQWEWRRKTGRIYPSREPGAVRRPSIQAESEYTKQQREKFLEKLLTHPIRGDQFIDGPPSKWRAFTLKWINTHQEGDNLIVSMKELLSDMKAGEITFNQIDSHVEHPVKEFLLFYQAGLKREMRRKVNIIFLD